MRADSFQPAAPGSLVPTTARQRRISEAGVEEVVPISGVAFVPDPLPPPRLDVPALITAISPRLLAAQSSLVRLDTAVAALPSPDFVVRPLGLTEVRASSEIENTHATLEELALVDADQAPPRHEVLEVRNNLLALEHSLASPLPVCTRLMLEAHRILMSDVRGGDKRPGEFRNSQVYIGSPHGGFAGATFVPPPPGPILNECIADFEKFVNGSSARASTPAPLPALVQIALSHYQFECIHPFSDGNGRLGRVLITILACKTGLVNHPVAHVSPFLERHRREYYDLLLRVSTHGAWTEWIDFFLAAVAEQSVAGLAAADRLRSLRDRTIRAAATRIDPTLLALIDLLFVTPAVTAASVSQRLGVATPAAQRAIDRLVKVAFLTEITGKKRDRVYVARAVLEAVDPDSRHPQR